jgi:methyl-accepting chemotaxis protein
LTWPAVNAFNHANKIKREKRHAHESEGQSPVPCRPPGVALCAGHQPDHVIHLQAQARHEVEETRERLLSDAKATLQSYVAVAMTAIKPLYDAAAPG